MWQRFTERARTALFFAQEEAVRKGNNQVQPEHLLVGVLVEPGPVLARAFELLGCDVNTLRTEISSRIRATEANAANDFTLGSATKRVVDEAYEVGRKYNSSTIESEHLLLGILADTQSVASVILRDLGISAYALSNALAKIIRGIPDQASAGVDSSAPIAQASMWARCSVGTRKAIFVAQQICQEQKQIDLGTEHLALGALHYPDCGASWTLTSMGYDIETVKTALVGALSPSIDGQVRDLNLNPEAKELVRLAYTFATKSGSEQMSTQHLLLAALAEKKGTAGRVLRGLGLELEFVEAHVNALPSDRLGDG